MEIPKLGSKWITNINTRPWKVTITNVDIINGLVEFKSDTGFYRWGLRQWPLTWKLDVEAMVVDDVNDFLK